MTQQLQQSQHPPYYSRHIKIPILLYVPNILGYIRILSAFLGLYYSILQQPIIAIIIWIFANILDLFDGIVARKLHQTSQFGIVLDIIADNILRTIIYIATCNAASVSNHVVVSSSTTTDVSSTIHSSVVIILISCSIICIEWLTMLSTQLYAAVNYHSTANASPVDIPTSSSSSSTTTMCGEESSSSSHWKKKITHSNDETEWWLIQYFFSNNFCNPLGILGIYGLFATNLFLYGNYYPIVYNYIPYYNIWMYLAFIGRFVSLMIELKFCHRFIQYIIQKDDDTKYK